MPYVFLSTKAPKKSYGKYTDTEILKQLEKIECSENSIVARLIESIMETLQNALEGNDKEFTKDVWGNIISIVDELKCAAACRSCFFISLSMSSFQSFL